MALDMYPEQPTAAQTKSTAAPEASQNPCLEPFGSTGGYQKGIGSAMFFHVFVLAIFAQGSQCLCGVCACVEHVCVKRAHGIHSDMSKKPQKPLLENPIVFV